MEAEVEEEYLLVLPIYEHGNGVSPAPRRIPEIPDGAAAAIAGPASDPATAGCHFVNCSHVDFAAKHVGRCACVLFFFSPVFLTEVTAETRARNWHTQSHSEKLKETGLGTGYRVPGWEMGTGLRVPVRVRVRVSVLLIGSNERCGAAT